MITNERLQEIAKPKSAGSIGGFYVSYPSEMREMAQELLTLRREKELLIENSERLAEIVNRYDLVCGLSIEVREFLFGTKP